MPLYANGIYYRVALCHETNHITLFEIRSNHMVLKCTFSLFLLGLSTVWSKLENGYSLEPNRTSENSKTDSLEPNRTLNSPLGAIRSGEMEQMEKSIRSVEMENYYMFFFIKFENFFSCFG